MYRHNNFTTNFPHTSAGFTPVMPAERAQPFAGIPRFIQTPQSSATVGSPSVSRADALGLGLGRGKGKGPGVSGANGLGLGKAGMKRHK
jgi:hypothetical protein